MLTVFYVPLLPQSSRFDVEGDEAHHAIKVLRTEVGEELLIADGTGEWAKVTVAQIGKRSFAVEVTERGVESTPRNSITVIQALMKSDRAKEAIELLTVAGVDRIIPWNAERSIAKWQEDLADKWRNTSIAAAKQSRRMRLPEITAPISTPEIAELFAKKGELLVLHEEATETLSQIIARKPDLRNISLLVGPEGGISPQEVSLLESEGATIVRLGNEVLRSAHAGFAATSALSALTGRW